ncbi:MAG: calcium-translocating P-type ATPase, PMCA-type, partial [Ruminococcus sp.]
SVIITVVMEGKSAKAFEELNKLNQNTEVKVVRNGNPQIISNGELTVGDIITVETGDRIPADCRIITSNNLLVDESALTGESDAVEKDGDYLCQSDKTPVAERKNMLYSGSFVTAGNGNAVVCCVGGKTEFGKIAEALAKTDKSQTPLQIKMASLGKGIAILGGIAALVIFIIQLISLLGSGNAGFDSIAEIFINSIVLLVAAVPEGLPTIVAVSLAINVIKMSKQNALVKKMIACETIGSVNIICTDKTGTLTENKMTATKFFCKGKICKPKELNDRYIIHNICINSTADIEKGCDTTKFAGNPTECALITAVEKSGVDYSEIRKNSKVQFVYPFSSDDKNMTTVTKENDTLTVFSKGSPEKILSLCVLPSGEKEIIEEEIINFQKKACRIIAFAHKTISYGEFCYTSQREILEEKLIFDGFAVITDPLREDVIESVKLCKKANIHLKMLTGDNLVTATAIAEQLNILDNNHRAVNARDLEDLSDEELRNQIPSISVIARSTPSVKLRVVNALKELGNVVAVTGDGINDAPAIKNADVGVAMGISGTDVTKQASDIVLLDDSFTTITKAIKWGRGIFQNIRRCIQFQLTVNVSSVLVVIASVLSGLSSPFTALELLWINIIMDGPPALTLGLNPVSDDLMKNKPTPKKEGLVNRDMMFKIAFNAVFIAVVFMLQTFTNFLGGSQGEQGTILFTLFVIFQLFNAFNSKALSNDSIFKGITQNKAMLLVFLLTFALQVVITQFGGFVFGTVPLSLSMWVKIVLTALTVIVVSEIVKLIFRTIEKSKTKQF